MVSSLRAVGLIPKGPGRGISVFASQGRGRPRFWNPKLGGRSGLDGSRRRCSNAWHLFLGPNPGDWTGGQAATAAGRHNAALCMASHGSWPMGVKAPKFAEPYGSCHSRSTGCCLASLPNYMPRNVSPIYYVPRCLINHMWTRGGVTHTFEKRQCRHFRSNLDGGQWPGAGGTPELVYWELQTQLPRHVASWAVAHRLTRPRGFICEAMLGVRRGAG